MFQLKRDEILLNSNKMKVYLEENRYFRYSTRNLDWQKTQSRFSLKFNDQITLKFYTFSSFDTKSAPFKFEAKILKKISSIEVNIEK